MDRRVPSDAQRQCAVGNNNWSALDGSSRVHRRIETGHPWVERSAARGSGPSCWDAGRWMKHGCNRGRRPCRFYEFGRRRSVFASKIGASLRGLSPHLFRAARRSYLGIVAQAAPAWSWFQVTVFAARPHGGRAFYPPEGNFGQVSAPEKVTWNSRMAVFFVFINALPAGAPLLGHGWVPFVLSFLRHEPVKLSEGNSGRLDFS